MKNIIIITGASSGIGREFALQIDQHFPSIDEIWLIARSKEKLKQTAALMIHETRILDMDITKPARIIMLIDLLKEEQACIRMLINCAGYGLMGKVEKVTPAGLNGMVRLNCEALTMMTRCCLPFMKRGSRIIQLASSASFLPQPGFAVYAATKSYVLSFSRARGEELRGRGIYVTSVCPGPVDTPFFEIAEQYGHTLSIKKLTMVSPQKVVALALKDSYYKRSRSVCSVLIRAFEILCKVFPHDLILRIMRVVK